MNKISTSPSKTLKLTNVLKYRCMMQQEDFNLNAAIERMKAYIKAKKVVQIGPLIQYMRPYVDGSGVFQMEVILMLQCNQPILMIEPPYSMDSIHKVSDCMYCRYTGPQEKLKYAYDKIEIEAFEQDTELRGDSYTVFVAVDYENDKMTADVFMPRREI